MTRPPKSPRDIDGTPLAAGDKVMCMDAGLSDGTLVYGGFYHVGPPQDHNEVWIKDRYWASTRFRKVQPNPEPSVEQLTRELLTAMETDWVDIDSVDARRAAEKLRKAMDAKTKATE